MGEREPVVDLFEPDVVEVTIKKCMPGKAKGFVDVKYMIRMADFFPVLRNIAPKPFLKDVGEVPLFFRCKKP